MPQRIWLALIVLTSLLATACSHHQQHHIYNESHRHNAYNTPNHPVALHDQDSHRDMVHEHEHFGGNP